MRIKLLLTFLVISIISIFLVIHFLTKNANSDTNALDTPQLNLPEGVKTRIGKGKIHDVAFLPDGTQFAVASSTGIWFYDANTYEIKALIATDKQAVKMMAFSSDGRTLATISENKAILIWDMQTLKHKTTFIRDSEPYYDFNFDFITFIGDGQTLVSTMPGKTDLWNLTKGTHQLKLTNFSIAGGVFSSDGRIVISHSHKDGVVYVWDAVEDNLLKKIKFHTSVPVSFYLKKGVALNSNGTTFAYGTNDNTIELWDIESGEHKNTLNGHKKEIVRLAFSPDGKTLASGSKDYSIILWDVAKGKRKKILKNHANEILKVDFSPDGKTLISFDRYGLLMLWDVNTGKQKYSLKDHVDIATSISLSPDGLTLVSGSPNGFIHLWDVGTGKHKQTIKAHKNGVSTVSFSSDGSTIASASWDRTVYLWDAATGKRKNSITKPSGNIRNVLFSPVDQLFSVATENSIYIWEVTPLQQKYPPIIFDQSGLSNGSVTFSPDGKIIASNRESHTIQMWDVETGSLIKNLKLKQHLWSTRDIAFSPDGKTLASLNPKSITIDLWDVKKGVQKQSYKDIQTLRQYGGSSLNRCEFNPDGKYLVAGSVNSTLSIWEVDSGYLFNTLNGLSHIVRDLTFSQDGTTLITSGDGTILVWDFASLINGSALN